jgi:TetR/AcrR family transcriptional regulator, regulator of biofilm formation and stress response
MIGPVKGGGDDERVPPMARRAHSEGDPKPSTRTRILLATLQLIADEGVDAVTHRAVAARAGVSPGSTTHHFDSREHLLREAFTFYLQEGEIEVRSAIADAGRGEPDPIKKVQREVLAIIEREFAEGLVRAEYELYLYACSDPELRDLVLAWESRIIAVFAGSLEAAGFARPVTSARSLLNMVRGYELQRLLDPDLGLEELAERLALLLEGPSSRG